MERISKAAFITVAVVLIAGVAGATVPDSDGVLHGCIKDRNGVLRVVENGEACRRSEEPLTWNQAGPEGPQGPAVSFKLVSGSSKFGYGTQLVTCPGDLFVIAATMRQEDGWGDMMRAIPVRLSASGEFEHSIMLDWTVSDWYEGDIVFWNITCGSV